MGNNTWKEVMSCAMFHIGEFYYWILQNVFSRVLKACYVRSVKGKERIPANGPFILAPNHPSRIDFMIVLASVPGKLHFFIKSRYFDSVPWRHFLLFMDQIRADKRGMRVGIQKLKAGEIVAIYPEGTRTKGDKVGNAKRGVAYLALKSGAPIIPMVIKNMSRLWPPQKIVEVCFCEPIEPDLGDLDVPGLLEELMNRLNGQLKCQ